jgi:hypothetical protein
LGKFFNTRLRQGYSESVREQAGAAGANGAETIQSEKIICVSSLFARRAGDSRADLFFSQSRQ